MKTPQDPVWLWSGIGCNNSISHQTTPGNCTSAMYTSHQYATTSMETATSHPLEISV